MKKNLIKTLAWQGFVFPSFYSFVVFIGLILFIYFFIQTEDYHWQ